MCNKTNHSFLNLYLLILVQVRQNLMLYVYIDLEVNLPKSISVLVSTFSCVGGVIVSV